MKYCAEYAALLDLFVDGELTGPEMERVRDHLETCPGCQAYVDDALAIRAGFPDAEETIVPEGFAEGVMARVREDAAKERKIVALRRRSVRRWMGTAAALAACCALVILVRTGPGFAGQTKNAAAPAGDSAVYDTAETAIAGEESGIAPQAAPELKEELTEGALEEDRAVPTERALENEAPAARSNMEDPYSGEHTLGASPLEKAAASEAARDDAQFDAASSAPEERPALYLSAEEAGDLLDGFDVVWENAVEWRYELNAEEYRALLESLNRVEELPETAQGPFLVVVTGSVE